MKISDEVAAELSRAPRLREISFNDVIISPHGLEALAKLPQLEEFSLQCPAFGTSTGSATKEHWLRDDGLRAIAGRTQLRSLSLFHTLITDEGINIAVQRAQKRKPIKHIGAVLLTRIRVRWLWPVHFAPA